MAEIEGAASKGTITATTYLTGDATDVNTSTSAGLVLMGGGTDVDAAIKWMLERSGGGDVVVIRSTGTNGYNKYMYNLAKVNSVETIVIDSRAKANLLLVRDKIKNAEALFIAGGDQWNYVNYWKDTPVEEAINYLVNIKNLPIGGTSAGLAILGSHYFSAQNGTVTSTQALPNPYTTLVQIGGNDFVNTPFMLNTITDSHYSQRTRQGRHIAFMARIMKDNLIANVKGIGVDEQTAVCIDQNGIGKVFGINDAYFLKNESSGPEICTSGNPLTWNLNSLAIKAYKIKGNSICNGNFDAVNWTFSGGTSFHYYVNNGILNTNPN
ncbi:MAG: cyanophycinase [Chitinophagaceae bacterium]|nr:MAG: cyanophycinase [Chitinophagaceae bacterium]